MSDSRARLNEVLRDLGYDVHGDVVVVRPTKSETMEVRRSEKALVVVISTDVGAAFRSSGVRLERFRQNPIVLWAHDYEGLPVARSLWERVRGGDSEDDTEMLVIKPQFHLDTELSREVWGLIEADAAVRWEIGVIPEEWHDSDVTTWVVVEVSAVPSDACAEYIRRRIKDRTITSPAMLRSVEGTDAAAESEPISNEDVFDEAVGPYSCRRDVGQESWRIVEGPGLELHFMMAAEAEVRVVELNAAWQHGHDYVVADAPTTPCINEPMPDGIEERVVELERWRGRIDQNCWAARRTLDGP